MAVKPGKVRGSSKAMFKSAPNEIGLQPASMLDLRLGVGHLTGQ
jgi:hypothetical protein